MSGNEQNQYMIYVNNAKKSYGSKTVFSDFCMKIPRGCIYGLLGASGCGKTTLLNCVLGLKQVDSGDVYVLGGKPGTPESGVPGPAVGYMPQEIALVAEFTVQDAVYYFGRIHNMDDWLIEERLETLKVLLDLPPINRQLKECSGGQQRRVSFAAAIVHKPQLLILDEPTVGLDPMLRDTIWNHLIDIAEKEQTTIIITTHYIEEARKAHKVGLMRHGKLLAEDSPERLMQLFNTETLEEVFLTLSEQQEEGQLHNPLQAVETSGSTDLQTSVPLKNKHYNYNFNALRLSKHHLKSLMLKNIKQFLRNTSGMAFTFAFPFIQIMPFLMAIGRDPHGLKLAIVNDDAHFPLCANYTKLGATVPYNTNNCQFTNLACRFLDEINTPLFNVDYYDNLHDAFEDVRHGQAVGVMQMAENFSAAYSHRVSDGNKVSSEDLDFSEIKVWLDMSNRQIGDLVELRLFQLFQNFQVSAFQDCNYLDKFGRIPLRFIFEYGTDQEQTVDTMLPGTLLSMIFMLGATLTSTIIVVERQAGVWDRSIIAGVSTLEIVVTHIATQFIPVLIQTGELIILSFVIYEHDYVGDMSLIFLFTLFQGLAGLLYGFCISVVSNSLIAAAISCSGSLITILLLCGIIWPLEGQHDCLRFISKCLPMTIPILSLRDVIQKGYGLNEWQVRNGLYVSILWILVMLVITICAIKATR